MFSGDNGRAADSYRPVTIGSLLSGKYWGIFDPKVHNSISFTPRQKGFVNDAGCFNDVHILNELMNLGKNGPGLVAVQLDS
jgi:hypothetical protein